LDGRRLAQSRHLDITEKDFSEDSGLAFKLTPGGVQVLRERPMELNVTGDFNYAGHGGMVNSHGIIYNAKSQHPRRAVLKSLFAGIQQAVPAVTAMTDVVLKLRELWT
jgi:hypothetical protein